MTSEAGPLQSESTHEPKQGNINTVVSLYLIWDEVLVSESK